MSRTKGGSGLSARAPAAACEPAANGHAASEGSAFVEAFDRITNPQKRACVVWFVRELSQGEGSSR